MPAAVTAPLAVVFTLPGDSVAYRRALHDLPNHVLAADVAAGLAAASHPHGPIRTRSVAGQYVTTMRRMALELEETGFGGGLAQLTTAGIVRYWLGCDYHRERRIRVVLRAFDAVHGGLDPGVRRHLEGRRINKALPSQPNRPYAEGEWQRLTTACTETISTAHRAHRAAREAAGRGADPHIHGATRENLGWLLRSTGPVPTAAVLDRLGPDANPAVARTQIPALHRALFPDADTALAYLTLFAMRTGIVPDGIDGLRIADITRTSATSVVLSYRKGRTGAEALTLPRDAVRLLDRWLAHSTPLREHAGALSDQLWIYAAGDQDGRGNGRVFARPRAQNHRRRWAVAAGLTGDDGRPLALHGGRIRATYQHRRDRSAWTGRTTIDPNHSAQVEGDHYLSSHTPAQLDALEAIIEAAQTELRRKAAPPVVLTSADAAAFTAGFPDLVAAAGLDTTGIAALLAGEQDMFVAACANPWNGPHAPTGTLCPARPWVCLLCPLAAFTPRHLPNLLRLKEYFSRQATQMTTAQFLGVFGPYAARLEQDVLPRFAAAAVAAAARDITDAAAELPLHLEELSL